VLRPAREWNGGTPWSRAIDGNSWSWPGP